MKRPSAFVAPKHVSVQKPLALEVQTASCSKPNVTLHSSGNDSMGVRGMDYKNEEIGASCDNWQKCDTTATESSNARDEETCLAEELAKWMATNGGRLPRKQTRERQTESECCRLEQRLFKYVRLQREALKARGGESLQKTVTSEAPHIGLGTHDEIWLEKYAALEYFLERSGDKSATYRNRKSPCPKEKQLAAWVNDQRNRHKGGLLSETREKKLYTLPGWRWADHEPPWMDMYKQLESWIERGGELEDLVVDDVGRLRGQKNVLAKWIQQQRQAYRRQNHGCLSALQIELLSNIDADANCDFPFPSCDDLSWDNHYDVLQWWGEQFDGLPIPSAKQREEGNNFGFDVDHPLYGWVHLGHFYYWSTRMIELDAEGVPAEDRHHHRYFLAVLNGRQTSQIRGWVAGRSGEPVRKRCEKKKAPAEDIQRG